MPPAVPGIGEEASGPASCPTVWPACAVVSLPLRPLRQAGPEATLTSLTPATFPRPTWLAPLRGAACRTAQLQSELAPQTFRGRCWGRRHVQTQVQLSGETGRRF